MRFFTTSCLMLGIYIDLKAKQEHSSVSISTPNIFRHQNKSQSIIEECLMKSGFIPTRKQEEPSLNENNLLKKRLLPQLNTPDFNSINLTLFYNSFLTNQSYIHLKNQDRMASRARIKSVLQSLENKGVDSALESMEQLNPHEASFILLAQYHLPDSKRNQAFLEKILASHVLEFDADIFLSLSLDQKRFFLKNLCAPVKMAKSCFEQMMKEYDLDLTLVSSYRFLSSVGVAYLFLQILQGLANPDCHLSHVQRLRLKKNLEELASDARFTLTLYSSESAISNASYQALLDFYSEQFKTKYSISSL